MPLKIRCPHCSRVLVAEDYTSGQFKRCPACDKIIRVPVPERIESPTPVDVAWECPSCRKDIAPGTAYCPHCHFDLVTGKRLPLVQRLRLVPLRMWMIWVVCLAAVGLVFFASLSVIRHRFQKPPPEAGRALPLRAPTASYDALAARLLEARDARERLASFRELTRLGTEAMPAVAAALEASLEEPDTPQRSRNQRAAIELFARSRDRRWLPLLTRCRQRATLAESALRVRAMLGDDQLLDQVVTTWLGRLRRQVFLDSVAKLAPSDVESAANAARRRAQAETERFADALRRLAKDEEQRVLERLAEMYWATWTWLGQRRGERYAAALFEIAMPPENKNLDWERTKEDIRAARRALGRAARRGSASAQAAAGLVLAQRAPQYKIVRDRIVADLAAGLPEREPLEQQRATWALAKLTSRTFGEVSAQDDPADASRDDVLAVIRWARSSAVAQPGPLRTRSSAYPQRPKLVWRVVTPRRQLESDLLHELQRGWKAADAALERWLSADIGCTPRLLEWLDPGQRRPSYPALTTALIMVSECNEQGVRQQLNLWRGASDQPGWVRALAYTVLGSLDARTGRWPSGWPAGLEQELPVTLDADGPTWEHFGRIIAAGGAAMRARLASSAADSLPQEMRARLLAAAERAGQHRRPGRPR